MKALHGRFPTEGTSNDEVPRFTAPLVAWRRVVYQAGVYPAVRVGHLEPNTMVFPGAREDLFLTTLYLLVAGGRPLGGFVGRSGPDDPMRPRPFYTLLGHVPEPAAEAGP